MNNYSQNRGSEGISSMTNYTYSDTFYKEIVYDDYADKVDTLVSDMVASNDKEFIL